MWVLRLINLIRCAIYSEHHLNLRSALLGWHRDATDGDKSEAKKAITPHIIHGSRTSEKYRDDLVLNVMGPLRHSERIRGCSKRQVPVLSFGHHARLLLAIVGFCRSLQSLW